MKRHFSFYYTLLGKEIYAPPKHKAYEYIEMFKNYDIKLASISRIVYNKYPDSTIIDIGANIGDSLVIIKSNAPKAKVICIEGNEYFFNYLLKNAVNYENVKCVKYFVSNTNGNVSVEKNQYIGSTSYNQSNGSGEVIKSYTLSEIIDNENITECKLIKSDTDGYDFKILISSLEVIKQSKPLLFFEYDINWSQDDYTNSIYLMKKLSEIGYSFIVYDNFGNYMQYLEVKKNSFFEHLNVYILQSKKFGGGYYYSDILAIHEQDNEIRDLVLDLEFSQVGKIKTE